MLDVSVDLSTPLEYAYTDLKKKLELWDRTYVIENPYKLSDLHAGANVSSGAISEQTEDVQVSGWGYNNNPQGLLHVCFTNAMFLGLNLIKKLPSI